MKTQRDPHQVTLQLKWEKIKDKENFKRRKRKSNQLSTREFLYGCWPTFQQKFYRLEESGIMYLKWWKEKKKNLPSRIPYPTSLSRFEDKELCTYLYMYINMYIYVYIYIFINMCIFIYIYTYICVYLYMYVFIYMYYKYTY